MTLTPEQAQFVEASPFALTTYITDDMEPRIAERMKAQALAEGHRPLLPPSKTTARGTQLPETATIVSCVLGIIRQRPLWTFSELKAETGLHHNKLQYSLDVCIIAGDVARIEAKGQRHRYAAVVK